ncbi:MAG TPA: SCO1664 family protein [Acidimicrobiales bacterium]|nr:SCO1664 family protein [Acidimicrobiales bacterium]
MAGSQREAGDEPVLELLRHAPMEVVGRITWSSNATFLVELGGEATAAAQSGAAQNGLAGNGLFAIYKPERGERGLWDFPQGLWKREVAAYELSRWLGWDLVPPTVERYDAPVGAGSLQHWVDALAEEHYFTLLEDPRNRDTLQAIALFDLVVNNADRKAGHCLAGVDGRLWAIDHGVCFHEEPKLRTVIWDFAGEPLPGSLVADLAELARGEVPETVARQLGGRELEALVRRAKAVRSRRRFPHPVGDFPYPWPLI